MWRRLVRGQHSSARHTYLVHDDEIPIDSKLVRRLLQDQFPQWATLHLERVFSNGTDNELFRLGSEMVVRLPRIHWAANDAEKEQKWLPILAPYLPVRIPTLLASGEPAVDYPWRWSVYRWLEGEHPHINKVANANQLAHEIGAFIAALHRIKVPSDGPSAGRGIALADCDGFTRAAIAALDGIFDVEALTRTWERVLDVAPWSRGPVWVHGDLSPGNLLLLHGHLDAVIDFGTLTTGDPASDFIVAWNLLPSRARLTLREAAHADDETWSRGRGWALSIALIQLPYYATRNPPLAVNARHVISEVLADVSAQNK